MPTLANPSLPFKTPWTTLSPKLCRARVETAQDVDGRCPNFESGSIIHNHSNKSTVRKFTSTAFGCHLSNCRRTGSDSCSAIFIPKQYRHSSFVCRQPARGSRRRINCLPTRPRIHLFANKRSRIDTSRCPSCSTFLQHSHEDILWSCAQAC